MLQCHERGLDVGDIVKRIHGSLLEKDPERRGLVRKSVVGKALGNWVNVSNEDLQVIESLFANDGFVRYESFINAVQEIIFVPKEQQVSIVRLVQLVNQAAEFGLEYRSCFTQFDTEEKGVLSISDFKKALGELGLEMTQPELNHLHSQYQCPDSKEIQYRALLDEVIASQPVFDGKTIGEAHGSDIEERLKQYLENCDVTNHDIWVTLEKYDTQLDGVISQEDLVSGLKTLGFKLTTIEGRRLVSRYRASLSLTQVKYRELLGSIMGSETTGEENPYHMNALERLSPDELKHICQSLSALGKKIFNFLDMKDVFEQFDFDCCGRISREDFLTALNWCEFQDTTDRGELLANRLANYLTIGETEKVDYRTVFLMLGEYNKQQEFKSNASLQKRALEMEDLIARIKDQVASLSASNVNYEQCFHALDTERTGMLSHAQFHRVLESMGIHLPLVKLSQVICQFETMDEDGKVMMLYQPFLNLVSSHVSEKDDPLDLSNVKLGDRFEIIRALRKFIHEAISREETPEMCFNDLCGNGDGSVTVDDLLDAVSLLGISTTPYEIRRTMNFPYLFRSPNSNTSLKPSNVPTMSRHFIKFSKNRRFEMSFQLFEEILGLPAGQKEESEFEIRLLGGGEECLTGNALIKQSLKEIIADYIKNDSSNITELFKEFEMHDTDETNLVDEVDVRILFASLLKLEISESEAHRLLKRLDVLSYSEASSITEETHQARFKFIVEILDGKESEKKAKKYNSVFPMNQECTNALVYYLHDKYQIKTDIIIPALDYSCVYDKLQNQLACGTQRVRYRKLLKILCDAFRVVSLEAEWWMEKVRDSSDLKHLLEGLSKIPDFPTRNEFKYPVSLFLVDKMKQEEEEAKMLAGNWARVFESTQFETVDKVGFLDSLQLNLSRKDHLALHRVFSDKDTQQYTQANDAFLKEDASFRGYISKSSFVNILNSIQRFTESGIEKLCRRFKLLSCFEYVVDYRAINRYFASFDIQTNESTDPSSGSIVWQYIWNTKDHSNHKHSFKQWRTRKDVFSRAVDIVNSLHERNCQEPEEWHNIALALVAVDAYIGTVAGTIPSLKKHFVDWSKKGHVFGLTKMIQGQESYVTLGYNLMGDNKEFIDLCNQAWQSAERKFKLKLFQHFQTRKPEEQTRKHVIEFMNELGRKKLQSIKHKDDIVEVEQKQEAEKERKRQKDLTHSYFVEKKDALRVAVPQPYECLDPELASMLSVMTHNFIHASHRGDLNRCREVMKRNGYISKHNFKKIDGDFDSDEYLRSKQELDNEDGIQSDSVRRTLRFNLWFERKAAREQSVEFLGHMVPPSLYEGTCSEMNNYWKDVGRALKGIDPNGNFIVFIEWSKGFASHSQCCSAWNEFPPKLKTVVNAWTWVHLRSVLTKIMVKCETSSLFPPFVKMVQHKLGKKKGDKVAFNKLALKLQRALPVEDLRSLLFTIGLRIRLQDEKRLEEFFPGSIGPTGTPCIRFGVLLGCFENDSIHISKMPADQRIEMALHIAGAPTNSMNNWDEQRNSLQNGLLFLAATSFSRRKFVNQLGQEKKLMKPPATPTVGHVEATATSIRLHYTVDNDDPVLFFNIERLDPMELLFKDPPKETIPLSSSAGNFLVENISPNTSCRFRVTAFNQHGPSTPTLYEAMTLPSVPHNLRVVKRTCDGATTRCRIGWGSILPNADVPVAIAPQMLQPSSEVGAYKPPDKSGITIYELVHVDTNQNDQKKNDGLIIYRGTSSICDICGLAPATVYTLCVRAVNGHGNPSALSVPINICTPILPCSPPKASSITDTSLGFTWKSYTFKASTTQWQETLGKWQNDPLPVIEYIVKLNKDTLFKTSDTSIIFPRLPPNTPASFTLRVVYTSANGDVFKSPWSTTLEVRTHPSPPSQPYIVFTSASYTVFKWYTPLGGCNSFQMDVKDCTGKNPWNFAYKGRNNMAILSNLTPGCVYRTRIVAIAEGKSIPSLPAQVVIPSKDEYVSITPQSARLDFTIPVRRNTIAQGDLLLFTHRKGLPCLRTMAARVVAMEDVKRVCLLVEWATVDVPEHKKVFVPSKGARVYVALDQVFELETEFGVYRMPWHEEAGRWPDGINN